MPTMQHITRHIQRYGLNHKALYALSFMLFFWAIFDGIISYVTPILITQHGISKTEMGLIIGSASIAGAFFDLTICRFFAKQHYRRIFLVMLLVCFIYPLVLWGANSFTLYLMAMALWGLFYDLKNFGRFDFIVRRTEGHERTSSFGVNQAFVSLGYLLAPLLAGLVIGITVDWQPLILAWIFLLFAFAFYFLLLKLTKRDQSWKNEDKKETKRNFLLEIYLWQKITKVLFPVLALTVCLNIFDSFFWTIGPLLAHGSESFGRFGGLIITAYQFPILILGWFVGSFTSRFGKKKTAFFAFLIGSLIISLITFNNNPVYMIIIIFLSSSALAVAWPSISGAYADYLDESDKHSTEIATLEDFCSNIGYFIGPIMAGFLADFMGEAAGFSTMGIFGAFIAIILIYTVPKKINVEKEMQAELTQN